MASSMRVVLTCVGQRHHTHEQLVIADRSFPGFRCFERGVHLLERVFGDLK